MCIPWGPNPQPWLCRFHNLPAELQEHSKRCHLLHSLREKNYLISNWNKWPSFKHQRHVKFMTHQVRRNFKYTKKSAMTSLDAWQNSAAQQKCTAEKHDNFSLSKICYTLVAKKPLLEFVSSTIRGEWKIARHSECIKTMLPIQQQNTPTHPHVCTVINFLVIHEQNNVLDNKKSGKSGAFLPKRIEGEGRLSKVVTSNPKRCS